MDSAAELAETRTAVAASEAGELLPFAQLVRLSIYWFGIQAIWGGLNQIILPARIDAIDPDNRGLLLGVLQAAGVVMAILVQPTVGMISDYTITRWGRRKPYIVIGSLLDVLFLVGLASSQTYLSIVAFLVLLQFSSNFAQGPFQGYVPDLVPARQVGMASGLMGTMLVLGTIGGVGVASVGNPNALWLATVALGLIELTTALVVVVSVREGSGAPARRTSWWGVARSAWGTDILRERSVLWLLVVRLLFLGAFNATALALFYFESSHGLDEDAADSTVFLATLIVGIMTALVAIPAARLSDLLGRRALIWIACGIAGLALAGVAVAPSVGLAIAAFVPFGIATGAFIAVDWALMSDVIPKDTTGRYMGILNVGTAAAGPLFLLVGGFVMDRVAALDAGAGPRAGMATAILFVAAAAWALTRVDATRREVAEQ